MGRGTFKDMDTLDLARPCHGKQNGRLFSWNRSRGNEATITLDRRQIHSAECVKNFRAVFISGSADFPPVKEHLYMPSCSYAIESYGTRIDYQSNAMFESRHLFHDLMCGVDSFPLVSSNSIDLAWFFMFKMEEIKMSRR